MPKRDMQAVLKALGRGDVVEAILAAPFGYTSRVVEGGFRFTIHDGPHQGEGEGATLLDAVRSALASSATPDEARPWTIASAGYSPETDEF